MMALRLAPPLVSLAALGVLWLLLTAGNPASWLLGVPTALWAWVTYRHLRAERHVPGPRISGWGALQFIPYFLRESIRGGVDVAWRVWSPHVAVQPDFFHYSVTLPAGVARAFFVYVIGLLPGTLTVEATDNGQLYIHALNAGSANPQGVATLERRIAALCGLTEAP